MGLRLRDTREGVIVAVYVKPSSRYERLTFIGDELEACIIEPPSRNKANLALIRLISRHLGIQTRQISIVKGTGSRVKELYIEGMDAATFRRLININPLH